MLGGAKDEAGRCGREGAAGEAEDYYRNYLSAVHLDLDRVESFREIRRLAVAGKARPRVLDIGCGIGYLTHYLGMAADAMGVDVNAGAVAAARRFYPLDTFHVLDVVTDDVTLLDGKFDAVVCNNLIEHLSSSSRKRLMSRIREKILKVDGVVVFGYADPYHPVQLAWGLLNRKVRFDPTHVFHWTVRQFRQVIEEEFALVEIRRTSPFTKWIGFGKRFKGDILVVARPKADAGGP